MRAAPQLLIALLWLYAAPGAAEVFRWTDEQGKLHFTQSLDQVPPRYRGEALTRAAERPTALQRYAEPARDGVPAHRTQRTVHIPFERHGTLMKVTARINDRFNAPFLIDTGASGVALPQATADRLGISIGPLTPRGFVSTANGIASLPMVKLDSIQLGGARVENLTAAVSPAMEIGLLGGSFFNNYIYRVDAAESVITLTLNDAMRGGLDESQWRERFHRIREPLAEVEAYLEEGEPTREGRRQELEQARAVLQRDLETLEIEANRAGVPRSWRE